MPDDQEALEPEDAATLRAELAASRAENAGLTRDRAMLQAGVNLESKTGQMFAKAYDGDIDVEKIKAEATEIVGALKTVDAPPADEVVREEGEETQLAERTALTTGTAAGAEEVDPKRQAYENATKSIAEGGRVVDASADAMHALVAAANAGDKRVLVEYADQ